jgi:hypothetical protein
MLPTLRVFEGAPLGSGRINVAHQGMRNVSRHLSNAECVEIDVKVLIYPRNNLLQHMAKLKFVNEKSLPEKRQALVGDTGFPR